MKDHPNRINAHIAAFYLAKFNDDAITELGCKTWKEAYIKISDACDYDKYTSINHFRDYFDRLVPGPRKGWKNPYELVVEIFNEFDNYDFETLSNIVKNILEKKYLFTIYDPPSIVNLSSAEKAQLKQVVQEEKQQKQQDRDPEEERHVLYLWEQEGGEREVPIFDCESNLRVGFADLITDTEIIEVKNTKNWKHAVGQVFAYWYYLSLANINKRLCPRIHLFGINGINDHRIQLCQSLMKKIFSPYIDSVVVTYTEDNLDFFEFDFSDI